MTTLISLQSIPVLVGIILIVLFQSRSDVNCFSSIASTIIQRQLVLNNIHSRIGLNRQFSQSTPSSSTLRLLSTASASSTSSVDYEYTILDENSATDQWELDCYSRPVVLENGKKLWEVLITDSNGSFRYVQQVPSNAVNSKQLRQIVDNVIEMVPTVKPNTIRFFRGAMFNMISIALQELPVTSKPSRCTFALSSWLEDRHENVYTKMVGYNKNMLQQSTSPSFLNVRTPIKLPDALRGEKYAFVALPVAEFLPGSGSVDETNIGVGRLCPLPTGLAADSFVQGIVILTSRAKALASWLAGTEMVGIQADLRKRILTMETDIDTQYLMAKLNDVQRIEAATFEEGKYNTAGLHFVSVQESDDTDPAGFWLLREPPIGI
jgi:RNA-binding protein Tab2/Atab2